MGRREEEALQSLLSIMTKAAQQVETSTFRPPTEWVLTPFMLHVATELTRETGGHHFTVERPDPRYPHGCVCGVPIRVAEGGAPVKLRTHYGDVLVVLNDLKYLRKE